jgi:hypothetical protein
MAGALYWPGNPARGTQGQLTGEGRGPSAPSRSAGERGYWTTVGFAITSDVPGVLAGTPNNGIA